MGPSRSAAAALGNIGGNAKEAVPALAAALKDQDSFVRCFAAEALGRIRENAKEAVPELAAALKDQDSFVRRYGCRTRRANFDLRPRANEWKSIS
jgi:HEAT repeat protein